MQVFTASVFFQAEKYNPTLRATVPAAWIVELDNPLPGSNLVPQAVGETKREAVANMIAILKDQGLTGSLRLHA